MTHELKKKEFLKKQSPTTKTTTHFFPETFQNKQNHGMEGRKAKIQKANTGLV